MFPQWGPSALGAVIGSGCSGAISGLALAWWGGGVCTMAFWQWWWAPPSARAGVDSASPGSSVLSLIHAFMSIWKCEYVSAMYFCLYVYVQVGVWGGDPAFNM